MSGEMFNIMLKCIVKWGATAVQPNVGMMKFLGSILVLNRKF